jgi:hydrogenase expression/formation protein HypC
VCLAVPGRIVSVAGEAPLGRVGRVDFGGIVKEVSLDFVPEACDGDYVLVHVGFALAVIDEREAIQVFELLREMGELVDAEECRPEEGSA